MSEQMIERAAPIWYQDYQRRYLSAEAHVFILYGDVAGLAYESMSHKGYLISQLAARRSIILQYDVARGITFPDEGMRENAIALLSSSQETVPTDEATDPFTAALAGLSGDSQDNSPRDPFSVSKPLQALRVIERLLQADGAQKQVAVIIEHTDAILPPAGKATMSSDQAIMLVLLQIWAMDSRLGARDIPIFLTTRRLEEIHPDLRRSSSGIKAIEIAYPDYEARLAYLNWYLQRREGRGRAIALVEMTREELARVTAGLSLRNLEDVLLLGAKQGGVTRLLVKSYKDAIIASENTETAEMLEPLEAGFAAVGGMEKLKAWFQAEIIEPVRLGLLGDVPKGVLLAGPPGTGKTHIIKALAREAGFNAVQLNLENILGSLLGESERKLKEFFSFCRSLTPVLVFLDELDQSDVSRRGTGSGNPAAANLFSAMLRFMGDETLRGKVIWMFASVSGDTPVLVRELGTTRFAPIGEVIDAYFPNNDEEGDVISPDLETLAVLPDQSVGWSHVQSVYRHRVSEAYDIHYGGGKARITATGNHSVFVLDEEAHIVPCLVSNLKAGDLLVIPAQSSGTREAEITVSLVDKQTIQAQERLEDILAMAKVSSQRRVATRFDINQSLVSQYVHQQTQPRGLGAAMPYSSVVLDEDFAWFLGLFTAEGYARKEVCITLSEREHDLLQRAETIMREKFGLPVTHRVANGAHHLIVYSAPLARRLKELVGANAHDKGIPSALWNAERSIALSYIKGWIDGDGSTNSLDHTVLTTVSQSLAHQGIWFLRLNGIAAQMDKIMIPERIIGRGQTIKATRAYRLHITGSENPWAERPRKQRNGAHGKRVPVALLRVVYQRLKPQRPRKSPQEYAYLSDSTRTFVSRTSARTILQSVYDNRRADDPIYERMLPFVFGDLGVAPVLHVELKSYHGFVYDFCGCDNECFLGGMSPIMLHNSNRPDLIDSALLRSGRIDAVIPVKLPNEAARREIVLAQAKMQQIAIAPEAVDFLAAKARKYSAADLAKIVAKARKLTMTKQPRVIDQAEAERAFASLKPSSPQQADWYTMLAVQACTDTDLLEPDEVSLKDNPAELRKQIKRLQPEELVREEREE